MKNVISGNRIGILTASLLAILPFSPTSEAGLIDGFSNGVDWTSNTLGTGSGPAFSGDSLTLTTTQQNEANTVYYDSAQPTTGDFSAAFTWDTTSASSQPADGFTFTIQNEGLNAIGNSGSALAYGFGGNNDGPGGIPDSIAISLATYSSNPNIGISLGQNGVFGSASNTGTVNIDALNEPIEFNISYTAATTTLSVNMTQGANSFSTSYNVNIAQVIGSSSAYVGFTGATGAGDSTQQFSHLQFNSGFNHGTTPTQLYFDNYGSNTVSQYNTDGTAVNTPLINGVYSGQGMAVSGTLVFIANVNAGTIGEYTTSGQVVNASLITGLNGPTQIAISGSNLFVANSYGNTVGEYTTSGSAVNASLISGLSAPQGLAVSGSDLFIGNVSLGNIVEYNTQGTLLSSSLITGLHGPVNIAISGTDLFVANDNNGTVGEYTTSGVTLESSFLTGLDVPVGIALSGTDLFVVNEGNGTIGEYTTAGTTVNDTLISGLDAPQGIVTAAVPEPSTWAMMAAGVGAWLAFRRGRRS